MQSQLFVVRLSASATLPTRASPFAAGLDLSSAEATVVPARGRALVRTGLIIGVPLDCYGRMAPRSGLAANHSIDVGAGVINADYRGEVMVPLINHGDRDFAVAPGDCVAQLLVERVCRVDVVVVKAGEMQLGGGGLGLG